MPAFPNLKVDYLQSLVQYLNTGDGTNSKEWR